MTIRVLIADDHPLVRDGLRFSLERSGKDVAVVGEATDGVEALALAPACRPDVFILDITMPRLNGLDAARELLRRNPAAKIILLSFHSTRPMVEEAMAIGVRGYLTKETASRNVFEAVCEVHAGRFYLSPDITGFLVEGTVQKGGRPPTARGISALTLQERRVLQLIAEGRSTKEIAAELKLSANTAHAHRTRLMAKLGIHKETDLVRFALKEGLTKL